MHRKHSAGSPTHINRGHCRFNDKSAFVRPVVHNHVVRRANLNIGRYEGLKKDVTLAAAKMTINAPSAHPLQASSTQVSRRQHLPSQLKKLNRKSKRPLPFVSEPLATPLLEAENRERVVRSRKKARDARAEETSYRTFIELDLAPTRAR